MTMTLVERLRGLLAKATPLPWVPNHAQPGAYARIETDAHGYFNDGWVIAAELLGPDADANIALIAEAINALPALLDALERLQMPGREEIARVIEQAARQSVPWPDKPSIDFDDDDNIVETRRTLDEFVNDTHIGGPDADKAFKAAAEAAADAILALFRARV